MLRSPKLRRLKLPPRKKGVSASDKGKLVRRLEAAAKELGIPDEAYEFRWARTAGGKGSDAWKAFERATVNQINEVGLTAKRVLRGGDLGESDVDVTIDEVPGLKLDCKFRQSHGHHSLFLKTEALYVKEPGDFLWMPTKVNGEAGSLVVMRSEVAFGLLRDSMGRTETNGFHCPCCRKALTEWQASPTGLSTATCGFCSLVTSVPTARVPLAPEEPAAANPEEPDHAQA